MFEQEPDVDTNTSPRSKLTVVGVNRRSAENRVHRQYWTGVPVHEYDVIMPGGMSYGLRTPRVAQYYQERECDTWEMQR
jgi:hypothetical protein